MKHLTARNQKAWCTASQLLYTTDMLRRRPLKPAHPTPFTFESIDAVLLSATTGGVLEMGKQFGHWYDNGVRTYDNNGVPVSK